MRAGEMGKASSGAQVDYYEDATDGDGRFAEAGALARLRRGVAAAGRMSRHVTHCSAFPPSPSAAPHSRRLALFDRDDSEVTYFVSGNVVEESGAHCDLGKSDYY